MTERALGAGRSQTNRHGRPHVDGLLCRGLCLHCLAAQVAEPAGGQGTPRPRVRAVVAAAAFVLLAGLGLGAPRQITTPMLRASQASAVLPVPLPPSVPVSAAATSTTGAAATSTSTSTSTNVEAAAKPSGPGYRLVAADGGVFNHGWYDHVGSAVGLARSPVVGIAQTSQGEGYWLASADGGIFTFGDAQFLGAPATDPIAAPIVGIAATPTGEGYWVASRDGGVFAYGDAQYAGAAVGAGLSHPIVAIAATPTGHGYWLASSDGGVFAFGDAPYLGSTGTLAIHGSVIGLVPTASGGGYWLVARDGGVFAFGDAQFFGAPVGQQLNSPITDMARTASGAGYWLVAADGGVFGYGDAPYLGSVAGHRLNAPVTAIAAGVGDHKPAPLPPPPAPQPAPTRPAPAPAPKRPTGGPDIGGRAGWDISFPQCGGAVPAAPFDFGIVGVNNGKPFTHNPCLAGQFHWAMASGAAGIYLNVAYMSSGADVAAAASTPYHPDCAGGPQCLAWNFGFNTVQDALAYARSQGADAPFVWLDVEVLNTWTPVREVNADVVRGAIDAVRLAGKEPGIYSTPYQWGRIAGAEAPGVPVWSAGAPNLESAGGWCAAKGFGGGPVAIVQTLPVQFDANVACAGAGSMRRYFKTK